MKLTLDFFKFLGRTGIDAKMFAVGTQKELEEMLKERREAKFLAAQQRERLIQIQREVEEPT